MSFTDEIMSLDEIKTDEESIYLFCNTLNAIQGSVRPYDQRLANVLLRAQGTITKLYKENKALKEGKESEHHSPTRNP